MKAHVREWGVRLVPDRSLPPYAYQPGGAQPHPTRDPTGHSFGAEGEDPRAFEWGVDLYHHGYFWEAHEAWEPLWRASAGPERSLMAGLIQCAAACLKRRAGRTEAERRLRQRALAHLGRVEGRVWGVDARGFAAAFRAWSASESPEPRPRIEVGG